VPKKNNKSIIIAIIAVGILIAAGAGVYFSNIFAQKPQNDEQLAKAIFQKMQAPTIAGAPVLGNASAPVTVVEFGDYLCTYCHRFHEDTKGKIIQDYVQTGKAKFVFKDFPINDYLGGGSSLGAQASYCAADQGKYWEFHDYMYNNWGGERAGWITKENMADFAQKAGISNIDQFRSCLDSGKYANVVKDNYNLAKSAGLSATPSFVVFSASGEPKLLVGAQPYQVFQQVIDESSS
jgi:protein-disulfide isomerase